MADLELLLDVAVINRGEELQRRAEAEGSWKGLDRGGTWSGFRGSYTLWPQWREKIPDNRSRPAIGRPNSLEGLSSGRRGKL